MRTCSAYQCNLGGITSNKILQMEKPRVVRVREVSEAKRGGGGPRWKLCWKLGRFRVKLFSSPWVECDMPWMKRGFVWVKIQLKCQFGQDILGNGFWGIRADIGGWNVWDRNRCGCINISGHTLMGRPAARLETMAVVIRSYVLVYIVVKRR